jgi:hypothetical protein
VKQGDILHTYRLIFEFGSEILEYEKENTCNNNMLYCGFIGGIFTVFDSGRLGRLRRGGGKLSCHH